MYGLTAFQRDVLYMVAGSEGEVEVPMIKKEIERLHGRAVKNGRLYSNLRQLYEKGLLERHMTDGRTYAYTTTRRGELEWAEKRQWEDSFTNSPENIIS